PAVGTGVGRSTVLIDLLEAAVRRRAGGGDVELASVRVEILLGGGVVVGVDDGDGAGPGRREVVGVAEVGRPVPGRGGRDERLALGVGDDLGVAGGNAGLSRV